MTTPIPIPTISSPTGFIEMGKDGTKMDDGNTGRTTATTPDVVDGGEHNHVAIAKGKNKTETDEDVEMEKGFKGIGIGRKELEKLVMRKVIEVKSRTELSALPDKNVQLLEMKDKLEKKINVLEMQVMELSRSIKILQENIAHPSKPQKPTLPVKFFRSVGLQVNADKHKPNKQVPSTIQVTDSSSTATMRQLEQSGSNALLRGVATQYGNASFAKGVYIPSVSVNELKTQVQLYPDKIRFPRTQIRFPMQDQQPIQTNLTDNLKIPTEVQVSIKRTNAESHSGLIDLTDDSKMEPCGITSTQNEKGVRFQCKPLTNSGPAVVLRLPVSSSGHNNKNVSSSNNVQMTAKLKIMNLRTSVPNPKPFILPSLPDPFGPVNHSHPGKVVKDKPPTPELTLNQDGNGGIILSWLQKTENIHAEVVNYQMFVCEEPLSTNTWKCQSKPSWKFVGMIKALPLPMACNLIQLLDDFRYYFIIRGLDVYNRNSDFCEIVSIDFPKI